MSKPTDAELTALSSLNKHGLSQNEVFNKKLN